VEYLLDTGTCVDLLRGVSAVARNAKGVAPNDCAISTITIYELVTGVRKCRQPEREQQKVDLFISTIHEVPFHRQAADRAAVVRAQLEQRGATVGPYDVLLAGQALADGLTLVTSNSGEFARIEGLRIIDWRAEQPRP